jgi:hypothetical protein
VSASSLVAVTYNSGPEVPADVLLRLRAISPQLGLRFYQGSGWAVMWKWREDDRRRAYIQRGELPADEDSDIVCYLPEGMDADQSVSFIEGKTSKHPTAHIRELCDTIRTQRDQQLDATFQPVMDEAMNQVEVNPSNLFAGIGKTMFKQFQGGFGKGTRTEAHRAPNAE